MYVAPGIDHYDECGYVLFIFYRIVQNLAFHNVVYQFHKYIISAECSTRLLLIQLIVHILSHRAISRFSLFMQRFQNCTALGTNTFQHPGQGVCTFVWFSKTRSNRRHVLSWVVIVQHTHSFPSSLLQEDGAGKIPQKNVILGTRQLQHAWWRALVGIWWWWADPVWVRGYQWHLSWWDTSGWFGQPLDQCDSAQAISATGTWAAADTFGTLWLGSWEPAFGGKERGETVIVLLAVAIIIDA